MNEERPSSDRRQYARFELLEYAMIYTLPESEPIRSVVTDVSLGGMQIRSRIELGPGQACRVLIGRGNHEPLCVHGETMHCTKIEGSELYATGFRFKPETNRERMELVDYVHRIFLSQGESLVI